MHVKELMNSQVAWCSPEDSLQRAAQRMWEGDFGAMPVVDAEGGVIGMITDRDICIAAYTQGCRLSEGQVKSAMSHEVQTCKASDSVGFAEELMRKYQVRRLPVLEAGKLVGILSINDVAHAAAGDQGTKSALQALGVTLARICEPRSHHVAAAE
jgi:CBS domain-containing protein